MLSQRVESERNGGLRFANPPYVLGAGDGWALSYTYRDLRRIAIDAGSRFADTLRQSGIEFHECDIGCDRFPLGSQSADLIMMHHVIEHIANPSHLMNEISRVLRPGGVLYVRTPNIKRVGPDFWNDHTHVKRYTPIGLAALASTFGFEQRAMLATTHTRICLDILTRGHLRPLICRGGAEIEAAFALNREPIDARQEPAQSNF